MVMMCGCSHRFLQLTLGPPGSFLAALEDYKRIQRRGNSTLPVDLFNVAQEARCTDCNIAILSIVRHNACNTLRKQNSPSNGPYSFLRNQHCGSLHTGFSEVRDGQILPVSQ